MEDELDDELPKGALEQSDELHNLMLHKELNTDEQHEVQQLLEERGELLETLDVAPGRRADGIVRLVYENVNGLQAKLGGNDKLEKIKTLLDDLEADVFAITEHRNNMIHRRNRRHGWHTWSEACGEPTSTKARIGFSIRRHKKEAQEWSHLENLQACWELVLWVSMNPALADGPIWSSEEKMGSPR